jgi:DNA-binding GntR family transcriptional regulator
MKPMHPNETPSLALNSERPKDEPSLHDEILSRLRDHIVEGNIAEGGRVPERQLCEMLKISRTPLREALKVLAAEGLVELLPNRGARVRALSEQDLGELFDVMGGLEGLAGRLACERITDEEIAEIERLHYEMYGFYLHRDMHGYFHINQSIHQKIVEASRNETLKTAYANISCSSTCATSRPPRSSTSRPVTRPPPNRPDCLRTGVNRPYFAFKIAFGAGKKKNTLER